MQHAHLVAANDFWRIKINQLFKTIVSVNHTAIQVIKVRCCKATTSQLHHWTKVRWNHWKNRQSEARWLDACCLHTFKNLKTLEQLLLTLTFGTFNLFGQFGNQCWKIDLVKQRLEGCTAHTDTDEFFIFFRKVAVINFVNQRTFDEALELCLFDVVFFIELFNFTRLLFGKRLNVSTLGLSFFFVTHLDSNATSFGLSLKISKILITRLDVNIQDNVGCEICDAFKVTNRNAEQKTHSTWRTTHEPDVRYRGCQLDVTHTLTANDAFGH